MLAPPPAPRVAVVDAKPPEFVTDGSALTLPPPDVAAHVTEMPGIGFDERSVTATASGLERAVPAAPACALPALSVIVVAPLAANVTGELAKPLAVAVYVLLPPPRPRVAVVEASPFEPDTELGEPTLPPPVPTAQVTVTPEHRVGAAVGDLRYEGAGESRSRHGGLAVAGATAMVCVPGFEERLAVGHPCSTSTAAESVSTMRPEIAMIPARADPKLFFLVCQGS